MKTNFWTENYSKCLEFFRESKKFILAAIILFFITAIVGFIFPIFFREQILLIFQEMIDTFSGKGALDSIIIIFFNNLKVAFLAIALGIGFGVLPFMACLINGYVLGFASREAVAESGLTVLAKLLPHGIFELPAILFSIGIGIKIGFDFFGEKTRKKTKENLIEAFRFFVFVIVPLLVIAAVIEGILVCI